MDSSCRRIRLSAQDFYVTSEGSLFLNATGKTLNVSQFEMESNSSALICEDESMQNYYFVYSAAQNYLSVVCLTLSVVCLALHIVIHAVLPKLRNLPGKNLLSLSVALFAAQLLFLTCIEQTDIHGLCVFLGMSTHWFYLSSFFWMNIMGFDICRTFSGRLQRPGHGDRTFLFYCLYAWGCPTMIVAIGGLVDLIASASEFAPHYGGHICWISNKKGLGIFFVLPVALLLLSNMFLFSKTVHSILEQKRAARFAVDKNQSYCRDNKRTASSAKKENDNFLPAEKKKENKKHNRKHKVRFVLYIKLALIMGLGWIFGFIAALAHVQALWYPFILFNGLQGAFIFVAFDAKLKIFYMLWQFVTKKPHPSAVRTTSKPTTSSSISVLVRSSMTAVTDIVSGDSGGHFQRRPVLAGAKPANNSGPMPVRQTNNRKVYN